MRLSENNYSKRILKLQQPCRIDTEGMIYTYESMNNTYDVAVIDNNKCYQTNMNGYTTRIDGIHNIHYAIINHFNI